MRPSIPTQAASAHGTEPIVLTLTRKRTFGDWGLGSGVTSQGKEVKLIGQAVIDMQEGTAYEVTGQLKQHPKYGEQLAVRTAMPYVAAERDALLKFLRKNFKGVGEKTALEILSWYEANDSLQALRQKLIYSPWELQTFSTSRSRKGIQFTSDRSNAVSFIHAQLCLRYAATQVPDSVLRRLAKWLFEEVQLKNQQEKKTDPIGFALELFAKDPFAPMIHVWGYGFRHADRIAEQLQMGGSHPSRMAAVAYYCLEQGTQGEGHTFLPKQLLARKIREFDSRIDVRLAIASAQDRGYPLVLDKQDRCYTVNLLNDERECARMLRELLGSDDPIRSKNSLQNFAKELESAQMRIGPAFRLDESQVRAVLNLLTSPRRLHTLAAGPGYGKTALMEVFVQLANCSVSFCAPTGKAARVLNARVSAYGFSASTIHQLLEPTMEGFGRNEDNPIDADVVVVDEASMLDLSLMKCLLLAISPQTHVVLVGDRDQLPSVGPGNVLADVLKLHADHNTLERTHRNAGAILGLVRQVRDGIFVPTQFDGAQDFIFVERGALDQGTLELLTAVYQEAVVKVGLKNVGLLVPLKKGSAHIPGWNTTFLNAHFQKLLNPSGVSIRGTNLRVGDRVIVRKNMLVAGGAGQSSQDKDVSVVNGDTGTLVELEMGTDEQMKSCSVALDDGRVACFELEQLDVLHLAYAMTVHAAQGSEYTVAIIGMVNGVATFMHRKLLYTALSRARQRLVLFGETAVLRAIARRSGAFRHSALINRTVSEN